MFAPHGSPSFMQILIPLLVAAVCLSFWAWMFREMVDNRNLTSSEKNSWMIVFVLFNVFAAAYYYATIYRNRR